MAYTYPQVHTYTLWVLYRIYMRVRSDHFNVLANCRLFVTNLSHIHPLLMMVLQLVVGPYDIENLFNKT